MQKLYITNITRPLGAWKWGRRGFVRVAVVDPEIGRVTGYERHRSTISIIFESEDYNLNSKSPARRIETVALAAAIVASIRTGLPIMNLDSWTRYIPLSEVLSSDTFCWRAKELPDGAVEMFVMEAWVKDAAA